MPSHSWPQRRFLRGRLTWGRCHCCTRGCGSIPPCHRRPGDTQPHGCSELVRSQHPPSVAPRCCPPVTVTLPRAPCPHAGVPWRAARPRGARPAGRSCWVALGLTAQSRLGTVLSAPAPLCHCPRGVTCVPMHPIARSLCQFRLGSGPQRFLQCHWRLVPNGDPMHTKRQIPSSPKSPCSAVGMEVGN